MLALLGNVRGVNEDEGIERRRGFGEGKGRDGGRGERERGWGLDRWRMWVRVG